MNKLYRSGGFSLIELLIAIAIVGILGAIAFPAYQSAAASSRRAEAKTALIDLQSRLQRFYVERGTFVGATIANVLGNNAITEGGWYQLTITPQSVTTYTISAAPRNAQLAMDTLCGTISVTNTNVRTITGTGTAAQCW
jgi:type IV pilus assembly protein PilE